MAPTPTRASPPTPPRTTSARLQPRARPCTRCRCTATSGSPIPSTRWRIATAPRPVRSIPPAARSRPISPSGRRPRPPSTSWRRTSTPTTSASSARSSPPTSAPTTRSLYRRASSAPTLAATSSTRWATAPSASRPSASTAPRRPRSLPIRSPMLTVPPRLPTTTRSSTLPAARSPSSIWKANCRPRSRTRARRARPSTLPPPTRLPPSAFPSPTEHILRGRRPSRDAPWWRSSARWSSWSAASTRASASPCPPPCCSRRPTCSSKSCAPRKGSTSTGSGRPRAS